MARSSQRIELEEGDRFEVREYFEGTTSPWVLIEMRNAAGRVLEFRFEIDLVNAAAWVAFAQRVQAAVEALHVEDARRNEHAA